MNRFATLLCFAVLVLASSISFAAPVNINTADAKTIEKTLIGVGSRTAGAIVSYREKHGPFQSVNDLEKVKGIGPKLIEKNRANILVK